MLISGCDSAGAGTTRDRNVRRSTQGAEGCPMTFPAPIAWLTFALLVVLATAPVWRLAVFGFNLALDDLLAIVCSAGP